MILDAHLLACAIRLDDTIITSDLDDFTRLTAHLGEAEPRARHWRRSTPAGHEGAQVLRGTTDCQSTGVLWRLMSPLLRIAIRVSDGKQLRLLKAMIEEG